MEKLKPNDPAKARRYFLRKLSFTLGPAELKKLLDDTYDFNIIDVRRAEDFAKGHIPGAVSLPEREWSTAKGLAGDKQNIIYCYTPVCHLAAKAAAFFAGLGYPVKEMEGGFAAWKDYGYEIEETIRERKSLAS